MSVLLEIQDGNPWWLSPDVWTVPNDPSGPAGLPVVGQPCYLWARVRNNGTEAVEDATVRFYWANPAVGFNRTTANFVGSSFASIDAGEQQDVLCLTPWIPSFVNGGHECILAEAFRDPDGIKPSDPLPPGVDFNVPQDRHVAQRNLSVVIALKSHFNISFEIHNPSREERCFGIHYKIGEPENLRYFHARMGKNFDLPSHLGRAAHIGFLSTACADPDDYRHAPAAIDRLCLPPGGRTGLSLVGLLQGEPALIHVVQQYEGLPVGGLSVLILEPGRA